MKLYKITAHCGGSIHEYYVVSKTTTEAEKAVASLHAVQGWAGIDSFDSQTVADQSPYGRPFPLIVHQHA